MDSMMQGPMMEPPGMPMAQPPMDPMMGGMGPAMGDPMGGDPMAMMAPGAGGMENPYPSTDPAVIAQIVALIGGLQEQDHMNLQMEQDGVLQMLLSALMPAPGGELGPPPMGDAGFVEGGDVPLAPMDEGMMF